jgi:hypothetical protein
MAPVAPVEPQPCPLEDLGIEVARVVDDDQKGPTGNERRCAVSETCLRELLLRRGEVDVELGVERFLGRRRLSSARRTLRLSYPRCVRLVWAVVAFVSVGATVAYARPAQQPRGAAGVSITLPAGWYAWNPPTDVTPAVTDPRTRVVAVSAPFQFAAGGCQVAAYSFPEDAVAIVVLEWVRLGRHDRWSPRPRRFTARTLPLHPSPAIECFAGPGGSVQFADHGRHFGVYLLAGRRAPSARVDRARAVLDTLTVSRR